MIEPNPAQLAVLIHRDGGPTPQEQGHRPTGATIRTCRMAGWLADVHPFGTTDEGRAAIRLVMPDYVSGTP